MSASRVLFLFAALALCHAAPPAVALGPVVSAGAVHTCAADSQGSAYCWGDNSAGQLGDGVIGAALKFDVTGLASGGAAIAAGQTHACAVTNAGRVLCWGNNDAGQLGDGTITSRSTPAPVAGLADARSLALGLGFSCALTAAGGVRCWGVNSGGQLGDGTLTKRPTPVDVVGLSSGVRAIAAGDAHACALMSAGAVKCWGRNDRGQLGDGTTAGRPLAADVPGLGGAIASIAAGATHSCAIGASGGAMCWGANDGGQLGDGTTVQRASPVAVAGLVGASKIAAGYRKSCALGTAGWVKCWGAGVDPTNTSPNPTDVAGLASGVADLAAGQYHWCAVMATAGMKCWGPNTRGELGDGTVVGSRDPVDVTGIPAGVRATALGASFTCALLASSGVQCWGDNFYGELGAANPKEYNVAARIASLANALSISAGRDHSCALVAGGVVKCWGNNGFGQLGDGTRTNRGAPADVAGLGAGVRAAYAGNEYSCAITPGGGLKCWGTGQPLPSDIGGLTSGVVAAALGGSHTCVLTSAGGAKCVGNNAAGQLGDGTTASRSIAVDVAGLTSGVAAISAGRAHTCALAASGALKCWGENAFGQLGNGTTSPSATPLDAAAAIGPFKAVMAGNAETCAVTIGGAAWCWGAAAEQLLGAARGQPAKVASLATGVAAITGGDTHFCALLDGGGVNCFGTNTAGQLGDGTKVGTRRAAQAAVMSDGRTFLDLTPENPLAADKLPPFAVVASGTGVDVTANLQVRAQDAGTLGSIYVFALVPPSLLASPGAVERSSKDTPLACVLAQLDATGVLQQVTASTLQAYVTGVLSAQSQAVIILNGVPATQLGGATFYIGYGSNGNAMIANGTNRSVATIGAPACQPQAPQTGWWWNPAEGGRGYSIEVQGNRIFFAAFHYDASGRATWNVASGATSLDGSLFTGDLLDVSGGQTLGGAYPGFPRVATRGPITLAFNDAAHGTMIWPGGAVPIERMNLVPGGLSAAPQPNQPESGWWWNPQESGRGFFIEWQAGYADVAGYMYDDSGNPIWYIAVYPTPSALVFSGNWWQYANGQTMTGPYQPATRISDHVAPMTIQFNGPDSAVLSLPNGRTTALTRQRF